jgi:transposase
MLNERRWRAVMMRLSGMRMQQVCILCELCANTVRAAVQAYEEGGWNAVAVRTRRGPDKGDGGL